MFLVDKIRREDPGLDMSYPSVSAVSDMVQMKPPTEALRFLAGCTSTSTDPSVIIKWLCRNPEGIAIGVPDHEREDYLVQGPGPSKLEQIFLFVHYFVYLASNNLLDEERSDKLVEWMIQSNTQWVLVPLLGLRTPTTKTFGRNILVSAARLGKVDIIRSLIARGVDVYASIAALLEAVLHQRPRVVELLLDEASSQLKIQISMEPWLLTYAFGGPHTLEMMKMLVNNGAIVTTDGDIFFYPIYDALLPSAVKAGDHKVTQYLLEAGAFINMVDSDLMTALQVAVDRWDIEAVQLLIDAGADINASAEHLINRTASDPDSWRGLSTAIQIASLAGNEEIVQILVNKGGDVNSFWRGAEHNREPWEEYRRCRWERCGDFEDTESYPRIIMTPLQAAVSTGNPALVQMLVEAGAHVDEEGYGDKPLQMAAALGEAEIVGTLLEHGADLNAPAVDEGGMTALQAAARADDHELVQILLNSGSEINAAASHSGGRTALQAAAENGNLLLAKFLIDAGANVNADASPESGRTCLQAAVELGHVEVVLMLLEEGADVNASAARISGGLTALQAALWSLDKDDEDRDIDNHGDDPGTDYVYNEELDTDAVQEQLDIDNNDEEIDTDDECKRPEVRKTKQSQNIILQALLNAGTDIGAPVSPRGGMTTLVAAVKTGRSDFVRWCLLRGADPNISDGGTTLLRAAVFQGSDKVVRLLIEGGADVNAHCEMKYGARQYTLWTALHVAAWTGRIGIANLLLDAGAEINMPLPHLSSLTTLQSAIAGSSITMVQYLLSKGADPHLWGTSMPIYDQEYLYSFVHMAILTALAVAGADFNRIVQKYRLRFAKEVMQKSLDSGALKHWTAEQKGHLLQAAIERGYTDLIQQLLDTGADVNTAAAYYEGRTALQRAAEQGYVDIVALLLSYGADVNAPAGYYGGRTALQGAALNGDLQIVLMLLKAGAEINAAPAVESGITALGAAAVFGRLDIVCLLLENNDDTEGMEIRCEAAAYLAEDKGHNVIARILREHKAGQGTAE